LSATRSEVDIRLAVEAAMIIARVLTAAAAKLDIRRFNARSWLPGSNGKLWVHEPVSAWRDR